MHPFIISSNGGIVRIRSRHGDYFYSVDTPTGGADFQWIPNFPVEFQNNNNNNNASSLLTVLFETPHNIVLTKDHFFLIGTDHIVFDGLHHVFEILAPDYHGLFCCCGAENSHVQNFQVVAGNQASLAEGGGWLMHPVTYNTTVKHCCSIGAVSARGGGLLGIDAICCTAMNCHYRGNILGEFAGGIFGQGAVQCEAVQCTSSVGNLFGEQAVCCSSDC